MVKRIVSWTQSRLGMWTMAALNIALAVPLVFALVDRHVAWRADRAIEQTRQEMIAAWLAEPMFAPDTHLDITLGTSPQDTKIIEGPESDGPRVLLTQTTGGRWYTQLWHDGRMICRSPLREPNEANYGPNSPRELEHTWADYMDESSGRCFKHLRPCETYEVRALRELWRVIDGDRYVRYAPPVKGTIEVPCDWRPS